MNIPGVSPLPAYYSVAKPSRSQQPPVLNSEGAQSAPTQPDGGGDGGQPSNSSTSPDYLAIDTLAALLSAQGKSVVAPNMALALTHDPSSDNGSPSSSTVSSTGKGRYEGHDCPECGGNAQMQRRFADKIDLNDYSKVDCPVCDGKGRRKGDDCPVCGGEAKIDRGDLERIDLRDYEDVKCPICHGAGRVQGEDCRACGGEGEMERRHEQNIDPGDYR